MKNFSIKWKPLAVSLGFSLGTGLVSGILTLGSMAKYREIYKPPFSPPGWVFPVVWTILYILMGTAAYLIYMSESENKRKALELYGLQLFVNGGWSFLFFRLDAYILAFVWLLLLWYLVSQTAKEFFKIDPLAAKLMVPYLAWITFAAYLNLAIAVYYV